MSLWADSSSMSSLCLKCPFAQGQIVLSLSSSSVHSFEEVTNEIPSPSATAFRSLSNLVFKSKVRLQSMLALNKSLLILSWIFISIHSLGSVWKASTCIFNYQRFTYTSFPLFPSTTSVPFPTSNFPRATQLFCISDHTEIAPHFNKSKNHGAT